MQEYTISFTFSRENYRDVTQSLWKEYFRSVISSYTVYTLLPLVIFMVYCISNDNPLALPFAVGLTLFAIVKWVALLRYKRRFFNNAEDIADRLEQDEAEIAYTFAHDWLEYRDNEKKLGYSWKIFSDFEAADNCIMIKFDGDHPTLVISRIDIGETGYDEIQAILEHKLSERWAVLAGS